ncbi:PREDICTED: cytochrome P450 302a1, mitochondrial-like isoform X2 [Wasmannia auropunctata]|uniref:cytochrome P450 302a1, mitochondrial-like isoform X2 n=1 Tax=Wasmannia auropunctata TaxID=64793 RepID=UPI0005EDA7C0|nr:PREDICTED: cytochrome P450 302a1, mitochondrial-like isoform X2 [Wasmannia auropunctata]
MMHHLMQSIFIARDFSLQTYGKCFYRSITKLTDTLEAAEKRKSVPLISNDVITASMQSHAIPTMNATVTTTKTMPLVETANFDIATESFKFPKVIPRVRIEKVPLPFEEIPGPMILKLWEKYWRYVPLLGRLSWNRNVTPIKYLFDEYGCIVRINGPLVNDIIMIHRPEHIAEVFNQESESPIRSSIDILQHYHLNHQKYRSAGAFSLEGLEWLEVKKKINQPLHETISDYVGKLDLVCDELVNKIRNIRNRQDEVPANFHQELTAWGMECFYVTMFNKHFGFLDSTSKSASEATKIINALITAHTYMSRCETGFQVWRFFETPFAKKLYAACDFLDEVIGKNICQTQNKLQASLLSKQEKSMDEEKNLPLLEKMMIQCIHPNDISILLMDMIILGVQAVINCEAFLLYFLAKNPRIQKRLYNEIMTVLSKTEHTLTKESLKDMPYLKACIKESLRLRPAFPYLTRLLPTTISLHGYTIPKGTFVIMANQITSQREEHFEDPEKYQPERWLNHDEYARNDYQEYSCLPFGYGIRSCLGKNMAETQMMLLTAKLIQEFTIEYDYAEIRSRFFMINVPNRALRFRFVDRNLKNDKKYGI